MIAQLLRAVRYCHERKVMLRNLDPMNIAIKKEIAIQDKEEVEVIKVVVSDFT